MKKRVTLDRVVVQRAIVIVDADDNGKAELDARAHASHLHDSEWEVVRSEGPTIVEIEDES